MLELDGLKAFRAVCETGGFTRAAEVLNLTQSTISHQIRRLEERVGRRLLERTTRTVRPSVEGEALLADARRILDQVAEIEARFASDAVKGEVRLGAPEEMAGRALPGAITRFRSRRPQVRVAVTVGLARNLRRSVAAGDLDLAVLKEAPARQGALSVEPLVWAGAERLLRQSILPVAFFPEPCEFRNQALRLLEKAGTRHETVMTCNSSQSLRALAREGLAVIVLPRSECPPELRLKRAAPALPKLPNMGYRLQVSGRADQVVHELRDLLTNYL
ncbi:MAG TPA: LysR family transcriptional regulator [Stellaceae bacterium]|nr:LysR family transcriptional regulator [Stellaceae bacterium]